MIISDFIYVFVICLFFLEVFEVSFIVRNSLKYYGQLILLNELYFIIGVRKDNKFY